MHRRTFLKSLIALPLLPPLLLEDHYVYEMIEHTNGIHQWITWTLKITKNGDLTDVFTGVDSEWVWDFVEKRIKPTDTYIETYETRQVVISGKRYLEQREETRRFDNEYMFVASNLNWSIVPPFAGNRQVGNLYFY